ncbi:MAG: TonB-dependent receptor, partial [Bacteroidales bacterium]|nr:TonB-dependent receptor [Bacteroidales bacterium]
FESGEELIGVNIFLDSSAIGTTSNSYGFYSLTLSKESYVLNFSFLGYSDCKIKVSLTNDTLINIKLKRSQLILNEVTISDKKIKAIESNYKTISIDKIKQLPSVFGEHDIIKAIQIESGVKNIGEGSSGLYIRGGNRDQNYVLIDEAPVYNISHLYGFVSVFNPDIVKDVKFYNTVFPSNFGGRISSVIDTKMKEGNRNKTSIYGGFSILSARLTATCPLIKEKSSVLIALRKSAFDLFIKPSETINIVPSFYDLNFKMNYKINDNNHLYLSTYHGTDFIKTFETFNNKWNNTTLTFRWNHIINKKAFLNTTILYSKYDNTFTLNNSSENVKPYIWETGVEDINAKLDYSWYINPKNTIKLGVNSIMHNYKPGQSNMLDNNNSKMLALESGAYVSNEIELFSNFYAEYGVRFSMFQNIGYAEWYSYDDSYNPVKLNIENGGIWNTYKQIEPRVIININKEKTNSYRLAYTRASQFVQVISNNSYSYTALETWMPSSKNIKPLISDNFLLGYFWDIEKAMFSTTAYYRIINNQIDYIDHAVLTDNPYNEGEIRSGKANAYGIEFNLSKKIGKTKGSVSYAYSRVMYTINGVTAKDTYRAPYDIPHDIKVQIVHEFSEKFKISTFWTFSSGRPATFPIGYHTGYPLTGLASMGWKPQIPIYDERNSGQFPNYHRLDLALIFDPPVKKNIKHSFTFSVYNLYAKRNPMGYEFNDRIDNKVAVFHFFRIIPNFSYSFKFN